MSRPYIDEWVPPKPNVQRFCQYRLVAGTRAGQRCGRFLRKANTIVCGDHRHRESSVIARKMDRDDILERLETESVAPDDFDPVCPNDAYAPALVAPIARPLSPTRFVGRPWSGVSDEHRAILGDDIDAVLSSMPAQDLQRTITALEMDTWEAEPEVGQALYEELLALRSRLIRSAC